MKSKLFLGIGVLLVMVGFSLFDISCATVNETTAPLGATLYTDKGPIEGAKYVAARADTFISGFSRDILGRRGENVFYGISLEDLTREVELQTAGGEKVVVTFDRIQYPQQTDDISGWAGVYFIVNDSGRPNDAGTDPDFSRYSASGQEARLRQWAEWNELKAGYDRNIAANRAAARPHIDKVTGFPPDRLPHYVASGEKLKAAGLDYNYMIFFDPGYITTGGFELHSPPFVQDSLAQVANEYEANLRRWDIDWKNKLVEINAAIIRFQTDGSVLVGQDQQYGAVCVFRVSEDAKLLNYNQGSVIRIRGTVTTVERSRENIFVGSSDLAVVLNDCIIVE
ncbi:MAG: OB-fold putative lipoprotein [Spirochaetaceae bacterium]|jgi:hypothetical protein|nr:OB-fold putative lipoprotein [Spirochaetaceae bacterium]